MMIAVSGEKSSFMTDALTAASADTLDALPLAPFLSGVLSGAVKPLLTGDDAAHAAGLKSMSLGFGGPDQTDGMGGSAAGGKRKKRKKSKKGKASKEEL